MTNSTSKLKNRIINYLEKSRYILLTPGAFSAYRNGCPIDLHRMNYRLRTMGINPKTILDVGAYKGFFSKAAHRVFPEAKIIAFEPLVDCYNELALLKESIKNFECFNIALSNKKEKSIIHRSSFAGSSSLLAMSDIHKNAFPDTAGEVIENISTELLDDFLLTRKLTLPILLKIDVQGYENYVLDGARETLKNCDFIICEMSFRELYKGQMLFKEMYCLMKDLGFQFAGPMSELLDPHTSEVLQIDGLFIKAK